MFRDFFAMFSRFFRNLLHEFVRLGIHASEIVGNGHFLAILHLGCDLIGVQFVASSADSAFYTVSFAWPGHDLLTINCMQVIV